MAPRAQNSPRGLFEKNVIKLNPQTVPTTRYGPGAMVAVMNSTGRSVAINTTGTTWAYAVHSSLPNAMLLTPLTTVPTTRYGPGALVMVANSTGQMLAVNTTATTWAYLNVTSVLA